MWVARELNLIIGLYILQYNNNMTGKKMITDRSIKSKGTNIIVLRWSYNVAIKNRNQIRNNVKLNVVFIKMDELTISYVTKVPICCWKANI